MTTAVFSGIETNAVEEARLVEEGEEIVDDKQRLKSIVFTINNYSDEDVEKLKGMSDIAKCMIAAKEIGESGTPHIQGFAELKCAKTRSALAKKYLPRAWIMKARGDGRQNFAYCKKGTQSKEEWQRDGVDGLRYGDDVDVVVEIGEPIGSGRRSDIERAVETLKDGATIQETAFEHPEVFFKYPHAVKQYRAMCVAPRDEKPEVIVRWGHAGLGKTHYAKKMDWPGERCYTWDPTLKGSHVVWFDGYDFEKKVILEEFRPGSLPYAQLLRLLDKYDAKVQVKGFVTEFVATKIVITSPVHPRAWYPNLMKGDGIEQLLSRIDKIYHHTGDDLRKGGSLDDLKILEEGVDEGQPILNSGDWHKAQFGDEAFFPGASNPTYYGSWA